MQKSWLHEEILLLALKDKAGTVEAGVRCEFAIAGAILAELLLHGRIRVVEAKKKKLADLVDATPLGDLLLDECLAKIGDAKRRAPLDTWVVRFSGIKNLRHRVATQLCEKGILRTDKDKVLHMFSRRIYPEIDPAPELELIRRLAAAIFTDVCEVDPSTVVLLSLAASADLLRIPFEKEALKKKEDRIQSLVNGELAGAAMHDAIQAMQMAMLVTTMVPITAAVT